MTVFTELEQTILKLIRKHKKPELPTQCWGKKKKKQGITLPDFRQYYKATIIKIVVQEQTYGSMKQNREPRNKPTTQSSINL